MRKLVITGLCVAGFLTGAQVSAAELSPWMGSQDQVPFQLDPLTKVAVTFAADPLQTGSIDSLPCKAKGCTYTLDTAKLPASRGSASQN